MENLRNYAVPENHSEKRHPKTYVKETGQGAN